jgi:hypothetical protein
LPASMNSSPRAMCASRAAKRRSSAPTVTARRSNQSILGQGQHQLRVPANFH